MEERDRRQAWATRHGVPTPTSSLHLLHLVPSLQQAVPYPQATAPVVFPRHPCNACSPSAYTDHPRWVPPGTSARALPYVSVSSTLKPRVLQVPCLCHLTTPVPTLCPAQGGPSTCPCPEVQRRPISADSNPGVKEAMAEGVRLPTGGLTDRDRGSP